ncbi:MAG: T9SS type A sorting domain-containing protein, partial [Bacteroidetes bacterium]|nr:T9SS type A sorting domain-containing protein [Bacteroidota bacterium]
GITTLTLRLDNPLDTLRHDVRAWVDTTTASHLRLAPGDSASRPPVDITAGGAYNPYWRFVLADPPASSTRDTLRFLYETDGMQYFCEHVIDIEVILIEKSVICDLMGTDSLSIAQIQSRTQAQLHYTLTNTGTVTVDVHRYELSVTPAAGFSETGLISLDPLTRAGGSIDPGNDITLDWRLRALILRASRTTQCTVTAFDANDSALAVCTHEMFLEGLDGLVCTLTAGDSVHFNRTELRYDPEEITASFALENLLDTEESNIEAVIDLSQAARFVLAPTESASKTIAVIDSHSTANLTWRLIPQPAPQAESQEIVVRYKSEQMAEWRECRATVFIEAWPEEVSVACATGGHDSLYADTHEERFIPDPLHVSYTVTNTGTVPLTACEAAIILPPEFALAGSDSIQSFTAPEYANEPGGPVYEGTLLPNASCTRWWKITPTQALADADPKVIRWQWTSAEQGAQSGCERTIHIIPGNPPGIVLTPLHLYFEAERGGALPTEQQVQLWTGGGLAMPWTAQPSEWWLDAQPVSGSLSAQIAVQPNSTQLDEGAHGAEILFAATPSEHRVGITYVIRRSTGIGEPPAPASLTLDAWPQPVPGGTRLHVRIGGESGASCRLTLHDLLGRERMSRTVKSGRSVSIDLATAQLTAGVYLLRALSEDGTQAVRMVSVVR